MLTRAVVRAAGTAGMEVVAVIDAAGPLPGRAHRVRTLARWVARRAFEPGMHAQGAPALSTSATIARRHGVPVLMRPERGVNDPAFVERVARDIRPHASIAFAFGEVFAPPLLEACARPANYHNGLLPSYRGIGATSWSVYDRAAISGFSFHLMSEGVDEGPVPLDGAVALGPDATGARVERAKATLAATRVPRVLEMLVEGAPGRPQEGEPSWFTRADLHAIRDVGDPSTLRWDDLERRIVSFGRIAVSLAGERWEITMLRRVDGRPRHPPLAFTTSDGVRAEPTRFAHLPLVLRRARERLRRGDG